MSTKQQTLQGALTFSGKGLHTGVKVTMTVHPADADTGIVFRRVDLEGKYHNLQQISAEAHT